MRHMRIDPWEGPGDKPVAHPKPMCVRERMSKPPVMVTATATLEEAQQRMADQRIDYLPVVNNEGRLVGVVNENDVLGTRPGARPPGYTIADVMSPPAISVGPSQSLGEAMQLMVRQRVRALPVVEGGRVIGILTQSDVVSALARG